MTLRPHSSATSRFAVVLTLAAALAVGAPAVATAATPATAALAGSAKVMSGTTAPAASSAVAPTASPTGAKAPPPGSWNIQGAGFGQGVGMSQYGASAMAVAGWDAAAILKYYYPGTQLAPARDDMTLVVSLQSGVTSATASTSALKSGGGTFTVAAKGRFLHGGTSAKLTFTRDGSMTVVSCLGCADGTSLSAETVTVTFNDGKTLLNAAARAYDVGILTVVPSTSGNTLEVGLRVRVHDEYLDRVADMPWSWGTATLQAQAVAARANALTRVAEGLRSSCQCHVYGDSRDQVFSPYPRGDDFAVWPRWKEAVRIGGTESTGVVPRYNGAIIKAYFSASNGGWTQAAADVVGTDYPYLRSVPDPWSLKPLNPMANWARPIQGNILAEAFGLPDVVRLDLADRTAGNAVRTAIATSSSGATSSLTGADFASRLNLPSTWVRHRGVRVTGSDQSSIAAAVARAVPITASTVVLTSSKSQALPDTITAPPLAVSLGAPLLLSDEYALPLSTVAELNRRQDHLTTAYLVGGPSSISERIEVQLRARGLTVTRIGGADRYEVAHNVATTLNGIRKVSSVVVVGGVALPDALSVAGPAAALGRPILFTPRDGLGQPAIDALTELAPTSAQVLGGTASVSEDAYAQIADRGIETIRLAGADRYVVSAAVAGYYGSSLSGTKVVLAAGEDAMLFDGLIGAMLTRPTVLTRRDRVSSAVMAYLQSDRELGTITAVGDDTRIADSTLLAFQNS